jgi:prepilin-type N-terminal cleavage/methylation domain-containing protein
MLRWIQRYFQSGERGFTLIELLVSVAILSALSAVVAPNVGGFIHAGEDESYKSELHNIQSAVHVLILDSTAKQLDQDYTTPTNDMGSIQADSGNLTLAMYLTGLDGTIVRSGCLYTCTQNGTVVQKTP